MSEPAIEIRGLKKSYHNIPVLKGIDLSVARRELTVLMGPSGCGKSTLLRCLIGLEAIDEGSIAVDGFLVEKRGAGATCDKAFERTAQRLRSMMGMVFQAFNLFPHMTVLDNVARPPMIVRRISPEEARACALGLLEKVGLADKIHAYPAQLSGGQQQRAAIARALAMKPRVLLYDEPTSALDLGLVAEVLEVMRELDREGITQLVITHEMQFAREVAKKVVFMSDGTVVEEGPPERIFSDPADARTRLFLKRLL